MGGTLSPNLLLGGESNGWVDGDRRAGNLSAALYYYPWAARGFFIKGGLGLSVRLTDEGSETRKGSGLGLTAGIGYDYRVGKNISLTPVLNYFYGSIGEFSTDGLVSAGDWNQNVVQLALGLTFH
jgi:outer membrane autotransporter protein